MRAFLASSVGVACTAALVVPLTVTAAPARAGRAEPTGSTQSLPLVPLADGAGVTANGTASRAGAAPQGLPPQAVRPFSLVGVVWKNADDDLSGQVQVRTRATGTGTWSPWQDLEAHNDDAPDPGSDERTRGGTVPLWVGDSDGVQARVRPEGSATLPEDLRLQLVDPGDEPAADRAPAPADPPEPPWPLPMLLPWLDEPQQAQPPVERPPAAGPKHGHKAPRPGIVTRKQWGASKKLREKGFVYTKSVKVVFVHHSATGNHYTCKQAPSVMRGIYRYHVKSMHWRDIGYNFVVDKCGRIYEGRAGGVSKAVRGAHTLGFNSNSAGVAVLGSYGAANPPAQAMNAVAKLAAWKLGLSGQSPSGFATLVSAGSNKFKKGRKVKFHAIAGHRDGFVTDCPGSRLYRKLSGTRTAAAKLQGR